MTHTLGRMMSRQQISEELQRTEDFEDVWEDFMECIEDHLEEVEMKWDHYDDEVWAKAIIFERNRRVAKVLFRKPVVVVDNNHDGYNDDGIIGLRGFENERRDPETVSTLKKVGKGFKVTMDNGGNIIVNKLTNKSIIYSAYLNEDSLLLEDGKSSKIFDMKKFQVHMKKEKKKEMPDWRELRREVLTTLSFGEYRDDPLEQPLWMLIINIVAFDLLRSKIRVYNEAQRSEAISKASSINSIDTIDTEVSSEKEKCPVKKTEERNTGASGVKAKKSLLGHPIGWHFIPPLKQKKHGSRLV